MNWSLINSAKFTDENCKNVINDEENSISAIRIAPNCKMDKFMADGLTCRKMTGDTFW